MCANFCANFPPMILHVSGLSAVRPAHFTPSFPLEAAEMSPAASHAAYASTRQYPEYFLLQTAMS